MIFLWDLCDLDKDTQEIGLENASSLAMVWDSPSAQVPHVVFRPSLRASVEIIAPVKVIWLRRIGSYIKNNEERV